MGIFSHRRSSEPEPPVQTPPPPTPGESTNFNTLVPPSPVSGVHESENPTRAHSFRGDDAGDDAPYYTGADDNLLAPAISGMSTRDPSGNRRVTIDFDEPYDKDNPMNWSDYKKAMVLSVCFFYAFLAGANGTAYTSGGHAVEAEFNTNPYVYLLGLTSLMTSVAFGPMLLAPLSEDLGRKYIYIVSCFIYTMLFIPQALAKNIVAIIVTRFFQGLVGSVGNSMVAGSVSDLYDSQHRGPAMSVFVLSVFTGQAIAPVISAAFALGQWRWMFWWQMIASGVCTTLMILCVSETRGSVVLMRRAARMTKEAQAAGEKVIYRARGQDNRVSMTTLIWQSSSRPFLFLTTEPVCCSFSLYVGMVWGTVFLSLSSVPITLKAAHNFTQLEACVALLGLGAGAWFGYFLGLHQDYLFQRDVRRNNGDAPPEARLYYPCVGAVLFPLGLFWFGWSEPYTHAACGIVGFVVCNMGIYLIYCGVFSYMADVYEQYASSALAAQSWARNMGGGTFPLLGQLMYTKLKPQYATTIIAGTATLLGIVPFVLFHFGERLRSRSKVAQRIRAEKAELTRTIAADRAKQARRAARAEHQAHKLASSSKGVHEEDSHPDTHMSQDSNGSTPHADLEKQA